MYKCHKVESRANDEQKTKLFIGHALLSFITPTLTSAYLLELICVFFIFNLSDVLHAKYQHGLEHCLA